MTVEARTGVNAAPVINHGEKQVGIPIVADIEHEEEFEKILDSEHEFT
jgi:hypothetical protein